MAIESIEHIAVIGAGLMGHGIAQEFASAGYQVRLQDVTDAQLQTACAQIEKNLNVLAENAIIERERHPFNVGTHSDRYSTRSSRSKRRFRRGSRHGELGAQTGGI